MLIQNAARDPEFCNHRAVRVGLTRYLGVPIRDPEGRPIGTVCFLDDHSDEPLGEEDVQFLSLLAMRVSAEVERERMVQARLEEHRVAAEQMRALNAQLEATAEEKRRFVAMILHDLRHPLTALEALLYLLSVEDNPAERRSYIEAIENRTAALRSLLDGLTEYHAIEAGQLPLHIERRDLGQLIRVCVKDFAPAFISDLVRLECDLDSDLGEAETDPGKVTHILLNLLSNALKFTTKGNVRVRAGPRGSEQWVLEVADSGIGIPAGEQERIFEEFYRAPAEAVGGPQGSGLGLAIVQRLCAAMNGSIAVESASGIGTTFRITFPRRLELEKRSEAREQTRQTGEENE